tara:strand:- start:1846 stop:2754 length:909 start_codon:yes stop_codon:yes gene_type:complete
MSNTKNNILNILSDDILEKIFCIKPCINKKLQKYFNNNIENLYNDFIKTTKNDRMIKLHIMSTYGIIPNCNNFIEKINDDENMYKMFMSFYNRLLNEHKCIYYNRLLNKYKLYNNNIYGVNYFIDDDYNLIDDDHNIHFYSDDRVFDDGIFIWKDFVFRNYLNDFITNFRLILNENFYKLFMNGDIIGQDEINEYIKSVAKLYIKKQSLKKLKKVYKNIKDLIKTYTNENPDDDGWTHRHHGKVRSNFYYYIEHFLCDVVNCYIEVVRPIYDDEDYFLKKYETYESFKIQKNIYNLIITHQK